MPTLTLLVDNTVRERGLLAQHGFSVWCEHAGSRVLFDTGAEGFVLRANAEQLGIDLATATGIALSHGHWDHGGGLLAAMDQAPAARVWIPQGALMPRWHRGEDGVRDIALQHPVRERLVVERARWAETSGPVRMADGIWLTGPVGGIRPAWTHKGLVRNEIMDVPDDVPEEQALVLDTREGLVVVVGCAHFGIANLLGFLGRFFPGRPLRALVGGLHLESAPETEIQLLAEQLGAAGVGCVVPCHCSGPSAAWRLAAAGWLTRQTSREIGCEPGRVGKVLHFPD